MNNLNQANTVQHAILKKINKKLRHNFTYKYTLLENLKAYYQNTPPHLSKTIQNMTKHKYQ